MVDASGEGAVEDEFVVAGGDVRSSANTEAAEAVCGRFSKRLKGVAAAGSDAQADASAEMVPASTPTTIPPSSPVSVLEALAKGPYLDVVRAIIMERLPSDVQRILALFAALPLEMAERSRSTMDAFELALQVANNSVSITADDYVSLLDAHLPPPVAFERLCTVVAAAEQAASPHCEVCKELAVARDLAGERAGAQSSSSSAISQSLAVLRGMEASTSAVVDTIISASAC